MLLLRVGDASGRPTSDETAYVAGSQPSNLVFLYQYQESTGPNIRASCGRKLAAQAGDASPAADAYWAYPPIAD